MESTFSGQTVIQRVNLAKQQGYFVQCYFVGLTDLALHVGRFQQRVLKGGHDIAKHLIEKRFTESVYHLVTYHDLFDDLYVIDNSLDCYRIQFSRYGQ